MALGGGVFVTQNKKLPGSYINFVTADNSVQSLSLEQLNVLLNECAQNGQHLYLLKWQYREQIEQAKTVEELNAIEFKFTMKDFSK